MELQRGKVGLDPRARPHGAQEIVRNLFSREKCLECGICCKDDDGLRIKVFGTEPGKNKLMAAARAKSQTCVKAGIFGSFTFHSPDACIFLQESQDGKRCSVYEIRPAICSIFPFMVQEAKTTGRNGQPETRTLTVLTSSCPSVRKTKEAGVSYIAQDEIVEFEKELVGYRIKIPILGESLIQVLECPDTKGLFPQESFLRVPEMGGIVFPIM